MADIAAIRSLIEPEVEALGFDLVRVAMTGGDTDPTLQVMAERRDTRQLDLSDCERISRHLSERFDVLEAEGRDPMAGGYRLEVSSPGIDRPLTRLADFDDWKGHEAKVTLKEKLDGRQRFNGQLVGIDADSDVVTIADKEGVSHHLPFEAIDTAKLLLTDKLINATAPLSTKGADTIEEDPSSPQGEMAEISDREE